MSNPNTFGQAPFTLGRLNVKCGFGLEIVNPSWQTWREQIVAALDEAAFVVVDTWGLSISNANFLAGSKYHQRAGYYAPNSGANRLVRRFSVLEVKGGIPPID